MEPQHFYNTEQTIALCTGYNNKADFIGLFNPKMLRDFAQTILDNFGEEPVYMYSHYSKSCTARALSASQTYGDEIQIGLSGMTTDNIVSEYERAAKEGM